MTAISGIDLMLLVVDIVGSSFSGPILYVFCSGMLSEYQILFIGGHEGLSRHWQFFVFQPYTLRLLLIPLILFCRISSNAIAWICVPTLPEWK